MIPINVLHSIKPIEVEGKIYALNKGDQSYIPDKLAHAMIKRGWATNMPKPERLGEVEGTEVRDVSRWVKGITGKQISRLKIGKNGLAISFVDSMNVTAGKVYTPFYSSVNNGTKESGFSGSRIASIFSAFKKGEKARLWWKCGDSSKLYIKETAGNLSWRHNLPNLEEVEKIPNLKEIPNAAIKIDVNDIKALKKVNGDRVAFVYGKDKAGMYVVENSETLTHIGEVKTEGDGEGIAVYDLARMVKVLKGVKSGFVRVEENTPAKFVIKPSRESKAVVFVAAIRDNALREAIAKEADAGEDNQAVEKAIAKEAVKLEKEIEKEEKINKTTLKAGWAIIREGIVENSQASSYKQGVRLERNGSFFRIAIDGCYPRGYTRKTEAVRRYEWLTEVQ